MAPSLRRLLVLCVLLCLPRIGLAAETAVPPLSLDEAVSMAMRNSSLIKEATENLQSDKEIARSARADLLPKLSTSYSYTRLEDEPYGIFNSTKVIMGGLDNYAWDLTARQPLFTGFALSARKKMAELGVDIGEMTREQAALDVVKQVKVAYYDLLLRQRFLQTAEETVTQLTAHSADAERFYDQGVIPYNDLLKSRVALADAQQKKLSAQGDREMAVSTFNVALRLPVNRPTEVQEVQPAPGPLPELPPLQEEALANRPELKGLDLAMKRAAQAVRLARSAYYPEVDLVGRYERQGEDPDAATNHFANADNASVGVTANWTFFEWGKKRAEVSSQEHLQQALAARIEQVKDAVRLEVKNDWLRLKVAATNIETARGSLGQAKENFRITRLQYQQGIATSTDVLDARTLLTTAESNYYNALYGYLAAAAELDRAVARPGKAT
ncbi:MAG: TolC family protein [Desulfobacteraceae bacterium]|nr:TolC family protein [Desulfobacteraceae bacterium]